MHSPKLLPLAFGLGALAAACGGSTTSPEAPAGDAVVTDSGASADSGANPEATVDDATSTDLGGDVADTPSGDTTGSGCITDTSAGSRVFTCDGFKYDVTIPPAC